MGCLGPSRVPVVRCGYRGDAEVLRGAKVKELILFVITLALAAAIGRFLWLYSDWCAPDD